MTTNNPDDLPITLASKVNSTDYSVSIFYENAGSAVLKGGITSFGQVLKEGQLSAGQNLVGVIGGKAVELQVDVKTTYADGSAKTVIVTTTRPDLAAGGSAELKLTVGAANTAPDLDLLAGLSKHSLSVALTGAGGATQSIDVLAALRDALAHGTASLWQEGPLATQARVVIPGPGAERLIFDVTVLKNGAMTVDVQVANDGAMQTGGGHIAQHVAITLDGRVAAVADFDMGLYQSWHESLSSTGRDGGQGLGTPTGGWLNIRHDIAQLQATGAVANYNLSQGVDAKLLEAWGAAAAAPGFEAPLSANGVTQYMPGTGGRADIGFTTAANTAWLMTQDPRAAAYAMGQAEAASAAPWHMWDALHGTWLGTDAYPKLWTDARGGVGTPGDAASTGLTQQAGSGSGWTLDSAHQPDLSYVPYLLTGQRWMLDNLQAQASWNIMSQWSAIRGGAADLVVQGGQVRGAAWSLRQIDEAAWASPDGSVEKAAFTEASAANWAWLVKQIPVWTAQQGEAYGWLPGDYGIAGALPPWQQDYFASTAIAAAKQGNADAATFLAWQANFLIGRFTHEAQGFAAHDGAAYLIAITDANGAPLKTWAAIGAQTVAHGWSNGDGWSQSQGDYAQLALATLAGIAEVTGSVEAAKAYYMLLAQDAPFSTTEDYLRDPTFWLAPPGAVPVAPPPPPRPAMEALSIVLGGEAWHGDPRAAVLVDGVEVFRGAVSAAHATGGAAIDLGLFSADVTHTIKVRYLNDAWGGTEAMDRNLYVEDILVNGVGTGHQADLMTNGIVAFKVAALPPVVATPEATPLRLGLSGDAWKGNAHVTVLLDGVVVVENLAIKAKHATGAVDYLDLTTTATSGAHVLTVRFLDDAYGGSAAKDRNAYIDSLTVDGVDQHQTASLFANGDAAMTFRIGAPETVDERLSASAGTDVLRFALSADSWAGDPHFLVLVDGVQIGGVQTTSARHAAGAQSFLDIHGDFDAGKHTAIIRFIDDAWGGDAAHDRNLYVENLRVNGIDQHQQAALLQSGDAVFHF